MSITTDEFVAAYVNAVRGSEMDLDRFVTTPTGLSPTQMIEAISHPGMGRLGLTLMADLMAPEGSLYYDAIFGAYHGQLAIRRWLLPAMAEIEFIDFVPTADGVMFDDGQGGSSVDEWQMVMNLDGAKIPLSLGVSVRRYRDGWITWGCDVYDTGAFRVPPPPEMVSDPPPEPLPPCPDLEWAGDADGSVIEDPRRMTTALHPTDSVYINPLVGELRGAEAINAYLAESLEASAGLVFVPLGPLLTNGNTSVQEWKALADSQHPITLRGTSVRRVVDGFVVYANDYFDTAALAS